jgi:hypothetical protein
MENSEMFKDCTGVEIRDLRSKSAVERRVSWQPIETAPRDGRQKILLKTPYAPNGTLAYSNTWWTCGFSVECKPTHWRPAR